jgi:hypothetical protein
VSLWLRVRGARAIIGAIVFTLIGVALPASGVAVTPSPAGATLAAACLVALAVPIAVGWGCARGDPQIEAVSVRAIRGLDLLIAALAVGTTSVASLAMQQAGLGLAGPIVARDGLVYLGLILLAYPLLGWRVATIVPAIYLLAVAVIGRGEDIIHPAWWAWIAADGGDQGSWVLTMVLLLAGIGAYIGVRPRMSGMPADE